jgi:hypothetical protein
VYTFTTSAATTTTTNNNNNNNFLQVTLRNRNLFHCTRRWGGL